ncbi:MAG: hypothetical protein H0U74_14325 [Bradymonadaceae bacterium]|nr:hypothetical protein [Lujinxingiaceae bacterium]
MKLVRRTGYVVLFGTSLLIFIPMIVGAAMGIHRDRIWDPFTGQPITRTETAIDCLDDAQHLMMAAGESRRLTSPWEQRYRLWVSRCRAEHADAFDMLRATRNALRGHRTGVGGLEDDPDEDLDDN